jgi:hypothetical protein
MPLDADVSAVHPRSADRGKLFCRGCSCFAPPVRARSAARASPRLLGIASAACFGAPLARDHLALPVYPTQLHAPRSQVMGAGVRAYSGHLLPPAGWGHPLSERVKRPQRVKRCLGNGIIVSGLANVRMILSAKLGPLSPAFALFWSIKVPKPLPCNIIPARSGIARSTGV